jgi:hypothetical protein
MATQTPTAEQLDEKAGEREGSVKMGVSKTVVEEKGCPWHMLIAMSPAGQPPIDPLEFTSYVVRTKRLGAVWPTVAQYKTINDFAAKLEGMGFKIQFAAPDTTAKFAVWTTFLQLLNAGNLQSESGEGKTVREATIAACERLLLYIQKVWDGDDIVKSRNEELMKKVLAMARDLSSE